LGIHAPNNNRCNFRYTKKPKFLIQCVYSINELLSYIALVLYSKVQAIQRLSSLILSQHKSNHWMKRGRLYQAKIMHQVEKVSITALGKSWALMFSWMVNVTWQTT